MIHLVIRLVLISLLFSSAYVAAETTCMDLDELQNQNNSLIELENLNPNTDDSNDCCDQFCQCLAQVAFIINYGSLKPDNHMEKKITFQSNLYSRSLAPLFRPPIV